VDHAGETLHISSSSERFFVKTVNAARQYKEKRLYDHVFLILILNIDIDVDDNDGRERKRRRNRIKIEIALLPLNCIRGRS